MLIAVAIAPMDTPAASARAIRHGGQPNYSTRAYLKTFPGHFRAKALCGGALTGSGVFGCALGIERLIF